MGDGDALRYSNEIDLDVVNDAHSLGIMLTPPGARVLDIGCAAGDVAGALAAAGARVWGVEIDPEAAERARAHCETVVVGDVEKLALSDHFEPHSFDVVLFLDVLEHLVEPVPVLRAVASLLNDTGKVIVSLPNVAHGALRLSLLRGDFQYGETGLLDRTHLHLYDAKAVAALFADAGFDVVEQLRVTRGLTETEIQVDPSAFPNEMVEELLRDPEAVTYQHIRVAVPRRDGQRRSRRHPNQTLTAKLQERVAELERMVRQGAAWAGELEEANRAKDIEIEAAAAHIRRLETELPDRVAELELALEKRMAELNDKHNEVRHLKLDQVVKDEYIARLRADHAATEEREAARLVDIDWLQSVRRGLEAEIEGLRAEVERLGDEGDRLRAEVRKHDQFRYHLADRANTTLRKAPPAHWALKSLLRAGGRARRRLRR